jgi:hypothetical protein
MVREEKTTETPLSKICSNERFEFRRDNFCQLHSTATQVSDFIQLLLEKLRLPTLITEKPVPQ